MAADSKKIKKVIKKAMDAKRFEHTLGVEYTACALAMCHNCLLYTSDAADD